MRHCADTIAMKMQKERMPATCAYDTVESTPLSMCDTSVHILDYRSYWLPMSVVFTLKDILGLSIFVSGGDEKSKTWYSPICPLRSHSLVCIENHLFIV